MSEDFEEHYRVLDLAPGASWTELKAAYRTKVRAWHPDRIQGNAALRQHAEDHTKSINHAYKQLANYFRAHGTLPLYSHAAPSELPTRAKPSTASAFSFDPEIPLPAASVKRHKDIGAVLLVLGLLASLYFVTLSTNPDSTHPRPNPPQQASTPTPGEPVANESLFAPGSTIGDVYSAQGVPTKTDGDVWYYGTSKVYFSNGTVVYWEQTPEHPLRARLRSSLAPAPANSMFGQGSTKTEVRRLQGEPLRESDNVWEYGVSRVYFEQDRVVSWYESPLDPLKVKRQPP